jgi:dihydrofolate reductase
MGFDVVIAADLDWGIGKDNALPWPRLRGDFAHFKAVTSTASANRRNAIVMGRKTWESKEIAGKPLPRRLNVVVSRRAITVPEGVVAATSIDDALDKRGDAETVFIIGGAEIYQLAIAHPALRHIYLTRVQGYFDCDVRVPDLSRDFVIDPSWPSEGLVDREESDVHYRIQRLYRRR